MVPSSGFRGAINPFKMQLDLEECDRPGSTDHIWSFQFQRPSFPNSWCLVLLLLLPLPPTPPPSPPPPYPLPVTAKDGILDWKSHTGQSHGQWFRSEAEIQFDFLFWILGVPWIKHARIHPDTKANGPVRIFTPSINSRRFFFARPMGCENIISTRTVLCKYGVTAKPVGASNALTKWQWCGFGSFEWSESVITLSRMNADMWRYAQLR